MWTTTWGYRVGGTFLATADFNGDGKLDVITSSDDGVFLSLGNGDGTFQPPTAIAETNVFHEQFWGGIVTGDFNGDGKMDFATTFDINTGGNDPVNTFAGIAV